MAVNRWTNIEIRPASPALLDYSEVDQQYTIEWPSVGLAVMVSEEELRQLVADAVLIQTQATMAGGPA